MIGTLYLAAFLFLAYRPEYDYRLWRNDPTSQPYQRVERTLDLFLCMSLPLFSI